ncbi:MAG: GDSL family lipase [Oscillospiraceae bacterium]|nr:GDSL family lipase [Oscillospiraceae bacterium]
MKKKFISGLISFTMAFSAAMGALPGTGNKASAAQTDWKFDLGGSGAAGGFTGVSASDGYNAGRGYGFSGKVANVNAQGSGAGADAVQFTGGQFNVDLPKGLYQVTVMTGNSPRTTINVEGMPQMINLTGNNAVESIQVPVTDGQLNVAAVAGMNNAAYTISSIEIKQLNTTGEMKPTIWICGDSTVANYYNVKDTAQHGWGQFLYKYVDTNTYEIRNQASSGQFAKGFYTSGQFDPIKTYGKAGDYYIISIGINDKNYSNESEYYEVVTDMVKTCKAKGMNVILVKQQGRRGDFNRNPKLTGRWFGGELDKVGSEQNVPVMDLFNAWQDFGFSIGGYDAMQSYYAIQANGSEDDLHQSAKGADKNAEILQGLMKIGEAQPEPSPSPSTDPSPDPTPSPSPSPSPTPEPLNMGDCNSDGKVNIADLIALKNTVLSGEYAAAADVTGDGELNAEDVQLLQKYLFGEDVTFTEPAPKEDPDKKYFAVDQVWDEGIIETTNSGFTDSRGYINLDNTDTSNITFTVNAAKDGNYMTHIRFANGTDTDRAMKIIVNGNESEYWMQSFTGTGAWTTWAEFGIVLPLVKGANTIKMISTVANQGGPNLDYITIGLTDEPIAETYDPNANQTPTTNSNPTLFILGDSTVQSYRESYAPQQGWGYYLGNYFTSDVTVANHSMAGRSSKKAYDEGRWQTIADSMKTGDFVMIMFAINDAGKSNADRYAPVCGNVDNPSSGSYEWYMTQFINDAKNKGGTPILVTTVIGMKAYSNGKFTNSYTDYCDACKKLASKYKIPCIDLNTIMVNHYNSVGYDTALSYHLMGAVQGSTDGTHFCEKGANVVAGLVAKAVKDQQISGLSQYVK